jgi:hypothetical protein
LKHQNFFRKSFFCRLKSVRDTLINPSLIKLQFNNYLTSEDKFRVVLNIKFNMSSLISQSTFLINKRGGYENSTSFYSLHTKSFFCLWNLALSPFIETTSSKFSFSYRPYRSVKNVVFAIKSYFLNKSSYYSFYIILYLKQNLTFKSSNWLRKFFPNKNKQLLSWLFEKRNLTLVPLNDPLFFNFFNYLFTNLVCILIVNIFNFYLN